MWHSYCAIRLTTSIRGAYQNISSKARDNARCAVKNSSKRCKEPQCQIGSWSKGLPQQMAFSLLKFLTFFCMLPGNNEPAITLNI